MGSYFLKVHACDDTESKDTELFAFGKLPKPFRFGLYVIRQDQENPVYRIGCGGVNGGQEGVAGRLKIHRRPNDAPRVVSRFFPIWTLEIGSDNQSVLPNVTKTCEDRLFDFFDSLEGAKRLGPEMDVKWKESLFWVKGISDAELVQKLNRILPDFEAIVAKAIPA